jgi:hypothetical protein
MKKTIAQPLEKWLVASLLQSLCTNDILWVFVTAQPQEDRLTYCEVLSSDCFLNAYAGASKWAFGSIYDQPPMVSAIPTCSSAAFFAWTV